MNEVRLQHASPVLLPARSRPRKSRPCPCRCGKPDGLCDAHKALLTHIREGLFGDHGRFGQRSDQRRVKIGSTCVNKACMQPRVPPAAFCPDCIAEGFTEETA